MQVAQWAPLWNFLSVLITVSVLIKIHTFRSKGGLHANIKLHFLILLSSAVYKYRPLGPVAIIMESHFRIHLYKVCKAKKKYSTC